MVVPLDEFSESDAMMCAVETCYLMIGIANG